MIVLSAKAKAECCCLFKAGIRHDVSEQLLSLGEACISSFLSVLMLDFLKLFGATLPFIQMFAKSVTAIPQSIYAAQDKFGHLGLTGWQK